MTRLVIVDDHPVFRHGLVSLFESNGFDVVGEAAGAAEAITVVSREKPDVVLLALGLPDGTGWDLMRRLRDRREIRGIAMSGLGQVEDLRKSREAGFLAHLTKPVDFTRLEATIQEMAPGP